MIDNTYAGSNIALIIGENVIVYKRDDIPTIPFPGFWDLPGGGCEGDETPEECALRELQEELSINLDVGRIIWKRRFDGQRDDGLAAYFFVAKLRREELGSIRLGDEGQFWDMMPIEEYLSSDRAIPVLKIRLKAYMEDQ